MRSRTIEQDLLDQRVIWILYREDERASVAVPASFHNLFPLNVLFSDTYPAADIHGRPVETVLNAISSFLCHYPEWQSVFSIPFDRPRAEVVSHLIETKGWRRLTADEGAQLQKLGMEVALGEWADATKSALYVS